MFLFPRQFGENRSFLILMAKSRDIQATIGLLVSKDRDSCFEFYRENFIPRTRRQAIIALDSIERYGDPEAFIEARRLKEWLLHNSSEASAE